MTVTPTLTPEEIRLLRWRLSQPHAQPLDAHVALALIDIIESKEAVAHAEETGATLR